MSDRSHLPAPDDPIDILLVEDNPGDVRLTRETFKATESETSLHVVTDGATAIDFLTQQRVVDSSARSLPDLILLDLNLPGKNGDEVLKTIKADPGLRHLPVIMLTSSKADDDIATCYSAHANAYLTKPIDPDEFVAIAQTVERFWFEQVQLPH